MLSLHATDVYEPLYTAGEMRTAEERYPGFPDTVPELMERAGAAVAREAMLAFPAAQRFACVCGGGSNGGDGRVAARVLRESGLDADETAEVEGYDVIVDAIFGTGFQGKPRADAAALIERINDAGAPVVSVDLPSGIDASTGEIAGVVVDADLTVTFHAPKLGLAWLRDASTRGGWWSRTSASTRPPPRTVARPWRFSITYLGGLRETPSTQPGSVLVIGGQPGMTGAACLSARAAFRADAGYVTLAVPSRRVPVAESLVLEAVKIGWTDEDAVDTIAAAAERAGAIALGPGLGRGSGRRALVRALLETIDLPAVVDADALFELEPFARAAPTVLTPHAGELARLLDTDSEWVGAHRLEAARRGAERFGAVLVLKGSDTIVVGPGGGATSAISARPLSRPQARAMS